MKRWILPSLLIAFAIAFRLLGSTAHNSLPNFQPLSALLFCSGALLSFGQFRNFGLGVLIWLITYRAPLWFGAPGSSEVNDPEILITTFSAFLISFLIGAAVQKRSNWLILMGSVLAALAFHLVTNTTAWIADPRYAKTALGFWQSFWSGLPTDPLPSWVFLQNMALANLIFTSVVLICLKVSKCQEDHTPRVILR